MTGEWEKWPWGPRTVASGEGAPNNEAEWNRYDQQRHPLFLRKSAQMIEKQEGWEWGLGEKREKMSARRHFWRGTPPCFCVSRGNKGVASEARVRRGNKRVRSGATWSVQLRGVETEKCPRNPFDWAQGNHETCSQIIASLSTVLCSTGTILRRKGNGSESEIEGSRSEENFPSVPKFSTASNWPSLFYDSS